MIDHKLISRYIIRLTYVKSNNWKRIFMSGVNGVNSYHHANTVRCTDSDLRSTRCDNDNDTGDYDNSNNSSNSNKVILVILVIIAILVIK